MADKIFRTEAALQSEFLRALSAIAPQLLLNGDVFVVNNEDKMGRPAAGVYPGISDVISLRYRLAIELKLEGQRHGREHVQQQLRWGMGQVAAGGCFIFFEGRNSTDAELLAYIVANIISEAGSGTASSKAIGLFKQSMKYNRYIDSHHLYLFKEAHQHFCKDAVLEISCFNS
jgi:hypothetical protein